MAPKHQDWPMARVLRNDAKARQAKVTKTATKPSRRGHIRKVSAAVSTELSDLSNAPSDSSELSDGSDASARSFETSLPGSRAAPPRFDSPTTLFDMGKSFLHLFQQDLQKLQTASARSKKNAVSRLITNDLDAFLGAYHAYTVEYGLHLQKESLKAATAARAVRKEAVAQTRAQVEKVNALNGTRAVRAAQKVAEEREKVDRMGVDSQVLWKNVLERVAKVLGE